MPVAELTLPSTTGGATSAASSEKPISAEASSFNTDSAERGSRFGDPTRDVEEDLLAMLDAILQGVNPTVTQQKPAETPLDMVPSSFLELLALP